MAKEKNVAPFVNSLHTTGETDYVNTEQRQEELNQTQEEYFTLTLSHS